MPSAAYLDKLAEQSDEFSSTGSGPELALSSTSWGEGQPKILASISTMGEISTPDFSRYNVARASAMMATARMSANQVSVEEEGRLISEHRKLAGDKVMNRLTPDGEARLEYVRWNLDRIEDARSGAALDTLGADLALYRQLAEDLKSLKESVDEFHEGRRRR